MPIWLRRFTFQKIQDWFNKQNAEIEKKKNTLTNTPKEEIARPAIKPDYSYKAPKK